MWGDHLQYVLYQGWRLRERSDVQQWNVRERRDVRF
jgi:hypothetical protein